MKKKIALFMAGLMLLSPLALQAQEKKSVLPEGDYMCKIDKGYKYRDCKVEVKDGKTMLIIPEGLISIEATLFEVEDSKTKVFAEAKLTDERSFGCFHCNAQCAAKPETCACTELPKEASSECMAQSVNFVLDKKGSTWKGKLPFKMYNNIYKDRKAVGWEAKAMILDVMIKKKK